VEIGCGNWKFEKKFRKGLTLVRGLCILKSNKKSTQSIPMKVSIFYLNENARYFDSSESIVIMSYNENGRQMHEEELSIEKHYTQVTTTFEWETDDVDGFLEELFHMYNTGMVRVISNRIQLGEVVGVGHSSMSVGDVIGLDNEFYIVEGIGFRKL